MSYTTIYDVAGAAGVSLATVSRVINSPEKVKPETRQRVLNAIKALNYRPNMIAKGLASKKTTTVGVIVSGETRDSVAQMIPGIADVANYFNYSIKLFMLFSDNDLESTLGEIIAEHVDGILYLNDELAQKDVARVRKAFDDNNIPYVFTNVNSNDPTVPSVAIDYVAATYEVTKRIIDTGAKHIYFVSTTERMSAHDRQEEGYEKAMKEANLQPQIMRTARDVEVNQQHIETYFAQRPIDAIVAARDTLAVSFMNVAIENGKKVPDDMQVVGMQNTNFSLLARPAMTAVSVPLFDIGAVAMRLLTKLMKQEEVDNLRVILPHQLVLRKTTK